jgi:membrane-associated phospholipid phosphatase
LFGLYLFANAQRRKQLLPFIWMAGLVNFLAVLVQFFFPTAPPWFTDSAVYDEVDGRFIRSANNEAGFERLDILFNVKLFHSIYGASPVKFGAMPSLHVAWPAIICVSKPWISLRFAIGHVAWIFWAALYSNHHYGVDAIAGIGLVLVVYFCMTRLYSPFEKRQSKSAEISPTNKLAMVI